MYLCVNKIQVCSHKGSRSVQNLSRKSPSAKLFGQFQTCSEYPLVNGIGLIKKKGQFSLKGRDDS